MHHIEIQTTVIGRYLEFVSLPLTHVRSRLVRPTHIARSGPFRESLFFGKLSDQISDKSSVELSFSHRHETDLADFGACRSEELRAATRSINAFDLL